MSFGFREPAHLSESLPLPVSWTIRPLLLTFPLLWRQLAFVLPFEKRESLPLGGVGFLVQNVIVPLAVGQRKIRAFNSTDIRPSPHEGQEVKSFGFMASLEIPQMSSSSQIPFFRNRPFPLY